MKYTLAAVLALVFAFGTLPAAAQTLQKVEILDFGTMTVGQDLGESSPPNEGFEHHYVDGARFEKKTRNVPGLPGASFGIRFRYIGQPVGAVVPVTVRLVFPPPGLKSPNGTKVLRMDDTHEDIVLGGTGFSSMTFDHPWEIIPGKWHIQIWAGGKKLADEEFNVFLPSS